MRYSINHTTTYTYHETVPLCHNIAILAPRNTSLQTCRSFNINISPVPEIMEEYEDFFGNKVFYFVIEQEHEVLSVTTTSVVDKKDPGEITQTITSPAWEKVREMISASTGNFINEKQFTIPTGITEPSEVIREYAVVSFPEGRPLFDAVYDLIQRIYHDFTYMAGFTTISTPLSEVMKERKGVCQDFAHLGISCIQAMGLPARYVSGYLETMAPPGKEKLTGADASHAWFSVYIPGTGWVDFDPTNNKIPDEQYITIGWGRNYFDIIPLRGVIMSSHKHELAVSVDVKRISGQAL
jgi:transglutaminase-like putative cysteine protease